MNLIPTIAAIGLMALTITAGLNYVSPSARSVAETAATITGGFQTLVQAYQSRQITGAQPPDVATWESALFPAYGSKPKAPDGTVWSYGSTSAGRWFCLTAAKATASLRAAMTSAGARYTAATYQVSGKCGDATVDSAGDSVAATLWVSREGS